MCFYRWISVFRIPVDTNRVLLLQLDMQESIYIPSENAGKTVCVQTSETKTSETRNSLAFKTTSTLSTTRWKVKFQKNTSFVEILPHAFLCRDLHIARQCGLHGSFSKFMISLNHPPSAPYAMAISGYFIPPCLGDVISNGGRKPFPTLKVMSRCLWRPEGLFQHGCRH